MRSKMDPAWNQWGHFVWLSARSQLPRQKYPVGRNTALTLWTRSPRTLYSRPQSLVPASDNVGGRWRSTPMGPGLRPVDYNLLSSRKVRTRPPAHAPRTPALVPIEHILTASRLMCCRRLPPPPPLPPPRPPPPSPSPILAAVAAAPARCCPSPGRRRRSIAWWALPTHPAGSPESSLSGPRPVSRPPTTSEVVGVQLPIRPAFGHVIYELLSTFEGALPPSNHAPAQPSHPPACTY